MEQSLPKALGGLRSVRVKTRHADKVLLLILPNTCGRLLIANIAVIVARMGIGSNLLSVPLDQRAEKLAFLSDALLGRDECRYLA